MTGVDVVVTHGALSPALGCALRAYGLAPVIVVGDRTLWARSDWFSPSLTGGSGDCLERRCQPGSDHGPGSPGDAQGYPSGCIPLSAAVGPGREGSAPGAGGRSGGGLGRGRPCCAALAIKASGIGTGTICPQARNRRRT
jgi:hypothetical protein